MSDFLASITPGAVGVWVVAIGLILKWSAEWRAWKKLPIDVQQANREGFTAQVDLLQKQLAASDAENRRTRAEIANYRAEFDAYRAEKNEEETKLRQTILKLEGELANLRRKLTSIAIRAVRGEMTSEDAQELHGIAVFFQDREVSQ